MENTKPVFDKKFFAPEVAQHKDKNIIWIRFPKDALLIAMLKSVTKPRWSQTQKSWYVTDNSFNRELFGLDQKIVGKEVLLKIHPNNLETFQKFQNQLILKGFSPNTLRVYSIEFAQLLYIIKAFRVEELTKEKLQSYFLYCIKELQLSENQIHSRINAVKFYFEKVLHQDKMFFDIPRPKKPVLLPKALNTTEISKIINITENPKHKLILQLCYGMGLRVSEIVNIKIEHIDSVTMTVLIDRGKGKKDRMVNLPQSVLAELRLYYKAFRPKEYLFEGQFGGRYAIRSAQAVFKAAMNKAGIRKTVGIHSLRHSYATHLLEFGTDISLIQKLMGHRDIKTTLGYTHVADRTVSGVQSPLDKL
ncbi:tyrosine-type recombinase/integrase [Chryseobacterium gotjawalense]|uniref:Tyrosine-type recombinase/integrase n=1 Tax=Chryseobacterium gotjawalense TaxID=3042315 RepID=A0ABY8RF04_9FLAO|nr:tyrosine-type recombinase/integrase [Chryseobacterium sp. wdc7]WHF52386.1 tyrosine-type recombinase/integrase [Chryseobacterium sp. wdc7]